MRALFVTAVVLFVAACAIDRTQPIVTTCPKMATYTPDQEKQAANELRAMKGQYPMVSRFMTDYGRERAALRFCQADLEPSKN